MKILLILLAVMMLAGAGCVQRIPSRDQTPSAPSPAFGRDPAGGGGIPSSSSNDDNLDEAFTELDLVE